MPSPTVSIITPSYNEEDYIEDTLKSVRDQTYTSLEHIVIDGGSTDSTTNILAEYEDDYNLTWYSDPDQGLYDAIEKGFSRANGEIYAWINANDVYFPWSIAIAVENLSKEGTDWITGRSAAIDEQGRLMYVSKIQQHYKRSWIRKGWYQGRGLGWFCQPSMFWTAELWELANGFPDDISLAGEHYLWRQFAQDFTLVSVNTILGAHREHEGQLSEDMERWYDEADPPLLPFLLGQLHLGDIYSLYRIFRGR